MPDRIVRQAILTSDRVNQLDCAAELFYRRLMSVVDDFGRFDARPPILRAACYPLRVDQVREADIPRWIAICEKAGLLVLYEVDKRPFLELLNLGDRRRAKHSKYPAPPARDGACQHMLADDNTCRQMRPDSDAHSDAHADSRGLAGEAADGDPVENQVRAYLTAEPMLQWTAQAQSDLTKLVRAKGWDYAKRFIDKGIRERAPFPVSYAMGCWQKDEKASAGAEPRNGHARSAVAVKGRRDR